MANTKSAIKRIRRISKQTVVNKARKSRFRNALKKMNLLIEDVKPTINTDVKLMGCERSLPYTETRNGILIDISSITIHDLKSHYVFGFKLSNIKE